MDWVEMIDQAAVAPFHQMHQAWLTPVMQAASWVGDEPRMVVLVVLAVLGFWLRGRPRLALLLALTMLLSLGLSQSAKYLVNRPRPNVGWNRDLIETPGSPSWPSGHSLNAMAFYLSLGLLLAREPRSRTARAALLAAGVLIPFTIGFSRMYLGVHYVSDVVGGWAAGAAMALLCKWAADRIDPIPVPSDSPTR